MDLTIGQIANFTPSAREYYDADYGDVKIDSRRTSPSDIPQIVDIIIENSRIIFNFDYISRESSRVIKQEQTSDWKIEYSLRTGRLYSVELSQTQDLNKINPVIKKIKNSFSKSRLKDNLRFGLDFINALSRHISEYDENKEKEIVLGS